MQEFLHRTRYAALILIGCLALEFLPWRSALAGEPARVEDIRVARDSSRITIVYNLVGENDEKYAVAVTMKRKSRPGVNYTPRNLSGDVGDEVVAGKDRHIVWEFASEFPRGLAPGDIYFSVDAEKGSSGISPLVWIGGGSRGRRRCRDTPSEEERRNVAASRGWFQLP